MGNFPIVVIGASAGGVRALRLLVSHFRPDFPAPLLVVQHIGAYRSLLPQLLSRSGPLPATHAVDGEAIEPGRIVVAPPDRHMLVEGRAIRLARGAKEHHTRPAIDPLFRSAAASFGPFTIGVLLTGLLDDGTMGLKAVKRRGGVAVVQDPSDAEMPGMPLSALRAETVDYSVGLAQMGPLIASLVAEAVSAEGWRRSGHARSTGSGKAGVGRRPGRTSAPRRSPRRAA